MRHLRRRSPWTDVKEACWHSYDKSNAHITWQQDATSQTHAPNTCACVTGVIGELASTFCRDSVTV